MNNNNCCGNTQRSSLRGWTDRALEVFPQNVSVAMAYVPFQQNTEVYSCEKALAEGSIFVCLNKPFMMGCSKC